MKNKKIVPLMSAIALFSGPAILVAACTTEITRYDAALPDDLENRILFDFIGVNYSVTAKTQFSSAFKAGMSFIKQEVEGIMAQQEFLNFFVKKLHYTEEEANATFTKIKDNLGLNILAQEYLESLNSGDSFDAKVYAKKLIFQTDSWHQTGTTKFNYDAVAFYQGENNPNTLFSSNSIYSELDNTEKDNRIKEVAKHADTHYGEDISALTAGNPTWETPTTADQEPPAWDAEKDTSATYDKKIERFKWWLRFRYQQYYYSQILPQLNQTLFTMAEILNSILTINSNSSGQPEIVIDNGTYAKQLQNWEPSSSWKSKYRLFWNFTTNLKTAQNINTNWNTNPLPNLIDSNELKINPDFLIRMNGTDRKIKNTLEPVLGINGFVNNPNGKEFSDENEIQTVDGWYRNKTDGSMYWNITNRGTFAYIAPVYWIDVIQNLDFNYYRENDQSLVIKKSNTKNEQLIRYWTTNPENDVASKSRFSQFMRGPEVPNKPNTNPEYQYFQNLKWNTFWQMLYFISSEADSNRNKENVKQNFLKAAKNLFPKFIRKENIYSIDFWNAVKEYY